MNAAIPFAPPLLGEEEKQAVLEVLDSGWLSRGPKCSEFEEAFAFAAEAEHAVSLSSCTAALHLALLSMDIGPGDEVITSPLTFPATINAILYVGATPVLVDVRDDYNLNPCQVMRAVTHRTRAVIGIDMHGRPCEKPAHLPTGVRFIRDAAHSLGGYVKGGRRVGSDADATCFSFYATKQITTGDGGMLTTNDEEIADRVRRLSLHGMDSQAWKRYAPGSRCLWDIPEIGYKYNMTDIQAAIGLEQLKKLPQFIERRRQLAERYDALLGPLSYHTQVILPPVKDCWHLYAIRVADRDQVMEQLRQAGIGCGIHFRPVHTLSAYADLLHGKTPEQLTPMACHIGDTTLSLPLFVSMTDEQQDRVVEILTEALS
jgi:dTDP-4-amino-4,6-dideoxygalactose transaminase